MPGCNFTQGLILELPILRFEYKMCMILSTILFQYDNLNIKYVRICPQSSFIVTATLYPSYDLDLKENECLKKMSRSAQLETFPFKLWNNIKNYFLLLQVADIFEKENKIVYFWLNRAQCEFSNTRYNCFH